MSRRTGAKEGRRYSQVEWVQPTSQSFSREEVSELRGVFNEVDTDGSGTINQQELQAMLGSAGQTYSDQELMDLMNEVDEDESGDISFDEFLSLMERIKGEASENSQHQWDGCV